MSQVKELRVALLSYFFKVLIIWECHKYQAKYILIVQTYILPLYNPLISISQQTLHNDFSSWTYMETHI
jgi:hypothetical protein